MKEIKDYLHLYLGCECRWEDSRTGDKGSGILSSVGKDMAEITVGRSYYECMPFEVKPILRPLSDMTEEEAGWIWQYSFESGLTTQIGKYFDYDISKITDNGEIVSINIHRTDRPDHCVNISTCDGGTIVFNDADVTKKPEFLWRPAHASTLFTYLLSKHFDLFNLIGEGLAIDKNSL